MAYPEYLSDFIKTHLLVYKDAGWLGDGLACSKYVSGVGTNQVPLAIVAAYMCGIRDFDIQKAYEASLKNEITSENRVFGAGKMDVGKFVKYGYVPYIERMKLPMNYGDFHVHILLNIHTPHMLLPRWQKLSEKSRITICL